MSPNGPPVITSVDPPAEGAGASVVLRGSGFGEATGTVGFRVPGGLPVAAETPEWGDDRVIVTVPAVDRFGGAGRLEVALTTAADTPSNVAEFTLLDSGPPAITAVNPAGAQLEGQNITVTGTRFGRPGAGQRLLLSGRAVAVAEWAPNRVIATLPSGAGVGGTRTLAAETPWGTSPAVDYTVRELPRLVSLSAAEVRPGDPLELRGSGFGSDQATVRVRLPEGTPGPVAATVLAWGDTRITVEAPPTDDLGGGPAEVLVETAAGRSGALEFILHEPSPPTVTAILPQNGQAEEHEIVLTGTGFGRQHSRAAVVFAPPATRATTVRAWSRTELRVLVPAVEAQFSAGVKDVHVTTPWGDSAPRTYEIGELPKIRGLSNEHVPPGAHVTLTGRAFGPLPEGTIEIVTVYGDDPFESPPPPQGGDEELETDRLPIEPISWRDDSIEVRLPGFSELRTTGAKQLVVTSKWGQGRPRAITISDRGSITTWTRIEPHARDNSLQAGLALGLEARVYDALWLLGRQYQLLELRATDGGSPIAVRVEAQSSALDRWAAPGADPSDLPPPQTVPLEALIEREPVVPPVTHAGARFPNRRLAVEAGLQFLRNLDARIRNPKKSDDYRKRFLREFPITKPTDADRMTLDGETFRFLSVMEGRAPDGNAMYSALRVALPPERGGQGTLPHKPHVAGNDRDALRLAIADWYDWCETLFSQGDPNTPTWNPERLEYGFAASADLSGHEVVLDASEYDGRRLDWHSFNRASAATTLRDGDHGAPAGTEIVHTVMAVPVTFPGAPVQRWWELEDPVDFGALTPGPTDLVRLFFIHFATVFGGDWFWVPIDAVPAGSVCRLDRLIVTDTFGVQTEVAAFTGGDAGTWRMFDLTHADGGVSPGLLFLPAALPSTLESAPLEDVRLFRDELANLAWAVEHTVEGQMAKPLDRHEAIQHARREAELAAGEPPPTPPDAPPLTYTLATTVPENWFPLLPRMETTDGGAVVARRLQRGAIRDASSGQPILPAGTLLEPTRPLAIYDEEVPRTGARITRIWQQGRAPNGATHLWLGRRRDIGRGEGSSGLRFDAVDVRR